MAHFSRLDPLQRVETLEPRSLLTIGTPVILGEGGNKITGTSITLGGAATPLASTINRGDTVILTFAMDANVGAVSVSDSKSNTYVLDFDAQEGSGTNGVRTLVFSARITEVANELSTTDTITVTFPSTAAKAVSAVKVAGLVTSVDGVDQTTFATGSLNGTTVQPNSGNVTTTQADEILIGLVGTEFKQVAFGSNATAGAGFTPFTGDFANSGDSGANNTNISILGQYRVVSAIGTYDSPLNIGISSQQVDWCAGLVTFRAAAVSVSVSPTSVNEDSGSGLVYTFSRNGITTSSETVHFTVSGTATSGTDYAAIGVSSVTIPANQASATITVTPTSDAIAEPNETVVLTITPNPAYLIGTPSATGTILNDDIGVSIAKITDLAEPGTNGKFRLTLSQALGIDTIVSYSVGGTATSGTDFTALSGTATILANTTTVDIDVSTLDDVAVEGTETVVVTLTGTNNVVTVTTGSGVATANITDNDATTVSITATDAIASETGANPGQFTVSLSGGVVAPTGGLTVNFVLTGSTATSGSDYSSIGTSVVIPAGQSSATINVSGIVDDAIVEADETVVVTLASTSIPSHATVSTTPATVTITDNDTSSLTIDDVTLNEGTGAGTTSFTFTVTLSAAVQGGLTVAYTTNNGTATTADSDYTDNDGSLNFTGTAGETRTITVLVTQDSKVEPNETFTVLLGALSNLAAGVNSTNITVQSSGGDGVITNDDLATVSITANDASASEPSDNGQFTVSLNTTSSSATTISYTVSGSATAGSDYSTLSGSVTIAANSTSATIDVTLLADTLIEGDETVIVTLGSITSGDPAIIVASSPNNTATVTISDTQDTATVSVTASDATAAEPSNNGQFTVSLSALSSTATTVSYTVTGSATAGSDYSTLSGSVTIPANTASATIDVSLLADSLVEGDETVIVTLGSVTSGDPQISVASSPNNTATVTISDTEDTATVSITANDATAAEPSNNGQFTVNLSTLSSTATTISYTVTGSATAGSDYSTLSGSVTIPANTASATIDVSLLADSLVEGDETVIVTLGSVTSGDPQISVASSPNNTATVTISDTEDTASVSITANDATAAEPSNNGQFTVNLSALSSTPTTISYTVTGSATAGSDYSTLSGSVTIPANTASATIDVSLLADSLVEGDETVIVTLGSVTSGDPQISVASSPNNTATVTISDTEDTASVSITANDATAAEPSNGGQFTVSLSALSSTATTISYTVTGSATAGSDYSTLSGSVTIPANTASATIDVSLLADTLVEGDETVIVTLGSVTSGDPQISIASSPNNTATVTISDTEDTATVSITANDATAAEPSNNGQFTVSLSALSSTATTVSYTVTGSATAGSDYSTLSGSVTIPANTASATIDVSTLQDVLLEGNETVIVTLGSVTSGDPQISIASSPNNAATVTIGDDESATLSIATPVTVTEGGGSQNIGVTLTITGAGTGTFALGSGITLSASVTQTGGTATSGMDYTAFGTQTVTFNLGATTGTVKNVSLAALEDSVYEGSETVLLTLGSLNAGGTATTLGTTANTTTISDNDVPPPVDTDTAANTVAEGTANGTAVGITASSVVPGGPSVTYSLTNNAGGRFAIDSNTGVVTVANGSLLNFETASSHSITVQASDGIGGTASTSFSISVTNVNPTTPTDGNGAANSVAEGAANGTTVGVTASSSDLNGPAVVYSLTNDAGGRFAINSSSGVVTVANGSLLDGPTTHTITVQASDGAGGTSSASFSINVNNVAPTIALTGDASVDEETPYTLNLGAITDPGSDTVTGYSINWGDGVTENFSGSPVGLAKLHTYADGGSFTITVSLTDEDGTFVAGTFALTVNFVVPTIALTGNATTNEGATYTLNLGTITNPGTVSGYSIDWGDGITESFSGNPQGTSKTHVYTDGQPIVRTISVSLTNQRGTFPAIGTLNVTVLNVAPTLAPTLGELYSVTYTGSDLQSLITTNPALAPSGTRVLTGSRLDFTNTVSTGILLDLPIIPAGQLAAGNTVIFTITADWDNLTADADLGWLISDGTTAVGGNLGQTSGTNSFFWLEQGTDAGTVVSPVSYPNVANLAGNKPFTTTVTVTPTGSVTVRGTNSLGGTWLYTTQVTATLNISNALNLLMVGDNAGESYGLKTLSLQAVGSGVFTNNGPISEGGAGSVYFTAVPFDPSPEDTAAPLKYSYDFGNDGIWDIGDGTWAGGVLASSVAIPASFNDGSRTLTVRGRVTDKDFAVDGDTSDNFSDYFTNVVITNVAPTIALSGASVVAPNVAYSLDLGAITDPGQDTVTSYSINWGDGSAVENFSGSPVGLTKMHTFTSEATRTITVSLTDEDGTFTGGTKIVTVSNSAPSIALTGNATTNEGSVYTLNLGAVTNPGTITGYSINWGDGVTDNFSGNPASTTATHTYADGSSAGTPRTIVVSITNGSGTFTSGSLGVTVNNVAPTISSASNNGPVNETSSVTVTVSASDPAGANDPLSYEFDFDNNGSYEVGPQSGNSAAHTFNDNGSYTVNVRVTDGDGGSTTSSTIVTVNNVAPTISSVSNNGPVNETGSVTVTVTASDVAGANDPLSYEFDFDNNGSFEVGPQAGNSAAHTFNDNGNYTVNVRVTDGDGGSTTSSTVITVNNVAPTISTVSNNGPVNEASPVTVTVSASDVAGANDPLSYEFDFDNNGSYEVGPQSSNSVAHTFNDNGSYTVNVRVTDGDGGSVTSSTVVTVNNVDPTISSVSNNGPVNTSSAVTVTVSASDVAGANDPLSYEFDFDNNGSYEVGPQAGNSAAHTFSVAGSYTVNVRVTDGDGGAATGSTVVTVSAAVPTIALTGNATTNEAALYTLNLGAVTNPGTISGYSINWGDGVTDNFAGSPASTTATHTYADGAAGGTPRTITVSITNGSGTFTAGTHSVTVNNVAPTIGTVSNNGPINETGSATVTVTASDVAGANDPLSYEFDFDNNGSYEVGPQAGNSAAHTFNDNGSYTVNVRVTDGDGGTATSSTVVTVNNVAPTISTVTNNGPINEGGSATVTVTASDAAGTNDPLSYEFDFDNNGSYEVGPQAGNSAAHTFNDNGSYTVNVRVTDGDGGSVTSSTVVTVNNVAPTIVLTGPGTATAGVVYSLDLGAITDPGTDTVTSYSINWGDGVTDNFVGSPVGLTKTHTYASAATRTITVSLTDEDGTFTGGTKSVTVSAAPTPPFNLGPTTYTGAQLHALVPGSASYPSGTQTLTGTRLDLTGTVLDGVVYRMPLVPSGTFTATSSVTFTTTVDWDNLSGGKGDNDFGIGISDGVNVIAGQVADQNRFFLEQGTDSGTRLTGVAYPNNANMTRTVPFTVEITVTPNGIKVRGTNGAGATFQHTATTSLNMANALSLVLMSNDVGEKYGVKTLTLQVATAGAFLNGGELLVTGTGANDEVLVRKSGDGTQVLVDTHFNIITGSSATTTSFPIASVTSVRMRLGSGDDKGFVRNNGSAWAMPSHVSGEDGNDLLATTDGNDTILGGRGRDFIIGGAGADSMDGGAGEDLLISGTTSHDNNTTALSALMAEWTSSGTYSQRLTRLQNGTGATAGNKLIGNDGATQTVFADASVDTLTGTADTDAFWANLVLDNGGALDVISDLTAGESTFDTDL